MQFTNPKKILAIVVIFVSACGTTTTPPPQSTSTPDKLEIEGALTSIDRSEDGTSSLYVLDTHVATVKIEVAYTTNNTAAEDVTLEYGIPDFVMQEERVSLRGDGPIFKFPLDVSFVVADAPADFWGHNLNDVHAAFPNLPVTDLVVPVSVAGAATAATGQSLVGAVIEADALAVEISKKFTLAELTFPNADTCVEIGQAVTAAIDDQGEENTELAAGALQSCVWTLDDLEVAACDATLEPDAVANTVIELRAAYPELTLFESYPVEVTDDCGP